MAFIVNTNRSSMDNCSTLCSADAPEIEVDKSWVHGGVGEEAVISCIVYGDPPPNVRWYRETMVLARNENRLMEQFGIRHRLVIARVSERDFGNYSCFAENDLGKSRGFIELSGNFVFKHNS